METKEILAQRDAELDLMWAKIAAEEKVYHAETARIEKRILRAIKSVKGQYFYRAVLATIKALKTNGYVDRMSFTKAPTGQSQDSDYRPIRKEWVQQWCTNMDGDSFAGFVYIQLKPKLFLKIPFNC